MRELVFEVSEETDGGYSAFCLTESIVAEGSTWDEFRANISEAVRGYFFDQPEKQQPLIKFIGETPRDRRRLLNLFWEFEKKITEIHAFYLDSIVGYEVLEQRVQSKREDIRKFLGEHELSSDEAQDQCGFLYKEISKHDFAPASMSPVMKQGDLLSRISENGSNTYLLGNQCVVMAYAFWDEYMRFEVAKALQLIPAESKRDKETQRVLAQCLTSDFWGDMRYLRRSIVHGNGIASSDVAKCKVLKWFKPGERILLDYKKMHRIFMMMAEHRNQVHTFSLPPAVKIRVE
jgi:predicted RNase H-like HicB family nuclease